MCGLTTFVQTTSYCVAGCLSRVAAYRTDCLMLYDISTCLRSLTSPSPLLQTSIQTDGYRSLREGEDVEFNIETGDDGRTKAVNVTGPNGAPPQVPFRSVFPSHSAPQVCRTMSSLPVVACRDPAFVGQLAVPHAPIGSVWSSVPPLTLNSFLPLHRAVTLILRRAVATAATAAAAAAAGVVAAAATPVAVAAASVVAAAVAVVALATSAASRATLPASAPTARCEFGGSPRLSLVRPATKRK